MAEPSDDDRIAQEALADKTEDRWAEAEVEIDLEEGDGP